MEKIEVDKSDIENNIDNNRDDIIYTEPAYTESAYTESAYTESAYTESAYTDTESVIETCKTYKGLIINGCINRSLLSSTLFIFPAIYGYLVSYKLIMYSSIICFFTSIVNHYFCSVHKYFRIIDIICVNSIALYFTFHSLFTIGFNTYSTIMYICALITLSIYLYIKFKPYLDKKYYCLVHLFAVIGIIFYIRAYIMYSSLSYSYLDI